MDTKNIQISAETRSILSIIKDNVCTLFNVVNLILAVLIFLTGSYQNLLFLVVVGANLAIALFQEIRAKRILDQLRLEVSQNYIVLKDDTKQSIPSNELKLQDIVFLSRGASIPCDMKINEGSVFVNEALITGESKSIEKHSGAELTSGSFITAGSCKATCIRVGSDTFLSKMNSETKQYTLHRSEIYEQLGLIIKVCSILLIPVGTFLFVSTYMQGNGLVEAIISSAGAMIGMIPQGLVLLTSSVFAVGAQILAHKKMLLQNLYAADLLSSIDTLVFDKTGTITSGDLEVVGFYDTKGKPLSIKQNKSEVFFTALNTVLQANVDDANKTTLPLQKALKNASVPVKEIQKAIPFSSETKHSGCLLKNKTTLFLGAPNFVHAKKEDEQALLASISTKNRILFLVEERGEKIKLLGAVELKDQLREGIKTTIAKCNVAKVNVKVVSGDGVETVRDACEAAGITHAEQVVDLSHVHTVKELEKMAEYASIFARALPQQKRELISLWQKQGHKVGMTGDGVNDVLALTAANCAISFKDASQAARSVSDVLLLNNDFTGVLASRTKGETSKNNLKASASFFLEKTILSFLLSLFCILFPPFLFAPILLTRFIK